MLSFPFPFRTFRSYRSGKGKVLSQLQISPFLGKDPFLGKELFQKLLKPFPVAEGAFLGKERTFPSCATFPGKGKDLSQLQPFLGKDLSLKWVQNNYSLQKLMVDRKSILFEFCSIYWQYTYVHKQWMA